MAAWERERTMVAQPQAIEGSSMDILSIEHLTKVYGTGPAAVRALDDVSLSIAAGEFVAIVGSSGSGK